MFLKRQIPAWARNARRLHGLKLAAREGCSCRLVPPGAGGLAERLDAVERRWGLVLPPSYREFLAVYDGWPSVYRGASLLSCEELLDPSLPIQAESVIEVANTPVPGLAPARAAWREDRLVPIGIDPSLDTLFVLDASSVRADGEMDAVAWISELGVRVPSFADLLDLVCELTEARMGRFAAEAAAA
jgi:hypothetical protein